LEALRSIALAPFGAWLRWALTRLPFERALSPRPLLLDLQPPTLLANSLAVLLQVGLLLFAANWPWINPFIYGFLGSLSTVSTLFAELKVLYDEKNPFAALRYCTLK
jgi:fluoride ion exporter CrcB/FEX